MKALTRVIVQVVNHTRPSGSVLGTRIQFAYPNMAGNVPFSKERAPSFRKPYFIREYYGEGDKDNQNPKDFERALRCMREEGFVVNDV